MSNQPKVLREWPSDEFPALLGGARRVRESLIAEDIIQLLKQPGLRFVVADVGLPLEWIPADSRFEFWKSEAKPCLCEGDVIHLESYPGDYCYEASQWETEAGTAIVLLFKHH